MSLTTEAELVQNSTLGALALWGFVNEFCTEARRQRGPELPLTMIVLPMVFHEDTIEAIRIRRYQGGLFSALAQNRALVVELQERAEKMAPQTLNALNLCFATGLLSFDKASGQVQAVRRTAPFRSEREATRRVIAAAERLGYWCCTINTSQLCSLLSIRF